MTRSTESYATDHGLQRLNAELRRLRGHPSNAASSYEFLIRTMHAELEVCVKQSIEKGYELEAARKKVRTLSEKVREQKKNQRTFVSEELKWGREKQELKEQLATARKSEQSQAGLNEQSHKYALDHASGFDEFEEDGAGHDTYVNLCRRINGLTCMCSVATIDDLQEPSSKKRKRADASSSPRTIVSCTQCYAHGLTWN